jgi:hypothetical protein
MLHRNITAGRYTMLQDEQTRHLLVYALVAFILIIPLALNMWAKRGRRRTRYKSDHTYGYGTNQSLNRFEKVLAWLRII